MDSDFPLTEYMKANGILKAVDVGRFAIHRDVPREDRASDWVRFIQGLIEYCREMG